MHRARCFAQQLVLPSQPSRRDAVALCIPFGNSRSLATQPKLPHKGTAVQQGRLCVSCGRLLHLHRAEEWQRIVLGHEIAGTSSKRSTPHPRRSGWLFLLASAAACPSCAAAAAAGAAASKRNKNTVREGPCLEATRNTHTHTLRTTIASFGHLVGLWFLHHQGSRRRVIFAPASPTWMPEVFVCAGGGCLRYTSFGSISRAPTHLDVRDGRSAASSKRVPELLW